MMGIMRGFIASLLCSLIGFAAAATTPKPPVFLEDMTWQEVAQEIQSGKTTVIIPTGGTEQNGPHMVLGKHNRILQYTAERIARELGNSLVAPVMAYVPEGNISPPQGHMRFAGTISLREATFKAMVEDTARSLKQHGFKTICLIAEHGGSLGALGDVASTLSEEWRAEGVHVVFVSHYYDTNNGQDSWLMSKDFPVEDIQGHAALADTSELMAIYPQGIRPEKVAANVASEESLTGAKGSSKQASAELGKHLLELKIAAAVRQIRQSSGAGSD